MRGFSTLGINLFDSFDHLTGNIKKIYYLQSEGRRFDPVNSHTDKKGFRKVKLLKPFFLAKILQKLNENK